ncbi:MAG: Na+/H+ antiporter NhaA, partial [Oscillospiraceae bacterium]|nr:Na+/H+ antiporter NhaA [Oscillospiraceae bacterium]
VVDDIGGILVIALFYSTHIDFGMLLTNMHFTEL